MIAENGKKDSTQAEHSQEIPLSELTEAERAMLDNRLFDLAVSLMALRATAPKMEGAALAEARELIKKIEATPTAKYTDKQTSDMATKAMLLVAEYIKMASGNSGLNCEIEMNNGEVTLNFSDITVEPMEADKSQIYFSNKTEAERGQLMALYIQKRLTFFGSHSKHLSLVGKAHDAVMAGEAHNKMLEFVSRPREYPTDKTKIMLTYDNDENGNPYKYPPKFTEKDRQTYDAVASLIMEAIDGKWKTPIFPMVLPQSEIIKSCPGAPKKPTKVQKQKTHDSMLRFGRTTSRLDARAEMDTRKIPGWKKEHESHLLDMKSERITKHGKMEAAYKILDMPDYLAYLIAAGNFITFPERYLSPLDESGKAIQISGQRADIVSYVLRRIMAVINSIENFKKYHTTRILERSILWDTMYKAIRPEETQPGKGKDRFRLYRDKAFVRDIMDFYAREGLITKPMVNDTRITFEIPGSEAILLEAKKRRQTAKGKALTAPAEAKTGKESDHEA